MSNEPHQINPINEAHQINERKVLAPIKNPTFINELPDTFQHVMYRAINEILNMRGNSATAKYRTIQWHNDQTRIESKRERQYQLIQKIRECYIIYLDYNNVVNNTPELAPGCRMYVNKNDPLEVRLTFIVSDWQKYRQVVQSAFGRDYSPAVGTEYSDTFLYNTETFEIYPYYSSVVEKLVERVDFLESDLDEMFPIYKYEPDVSAKEKYKTPKSPINISVQQYLNNAALIQSSVLKVEEVHVKYKALLYKKLCVLYESNMLPNTISSEIENLALDVDSSFTALVAALNTLKKYNPKHRELNSLGSERGVEYNDSFAAYTREIEQIGKDRNIQPPATPTIHPSFNPYHPALPNSQIGEIRIPTSEPEEIAQLVKDWFPDQPESITPIAPKQLTPAELATINKSIGEGLSMMLAVPTPVVTESNPYITTQDKPEPADPRYNKYFEDAPIPNSVKLYTRIDFMNAGCPGDDFGAWLDEQKARDAKDAQDNNHTSH